MKLSATRWLVALVLAASACASDDGSRRDREEESKAHEEIREARDEADEELREADEEVSEGIEKAREKIREAFE